MVKAIFLDFYGTVVHENSPISNEVIKRIYKSGTADTPDIIVKQWWEAFSNRLRDCSGENHRKQYELTLESFEETLLHFDSKENVKELTDMMVKHWCNPPLYSDTKTFMENVDLPIYFVTNSDNLFVNEAVKSHGLNPAGIVTSEQAKHYKPHKEIFLYALDKFNLSPDEVIHIGDSMTGDVECPHSVGIKAIWLNREYKQIPEGTLTAANLIEAQRLLSDMLENN